jgi:hypothetical protein
MSVWVFVLDPTQLVKLKLIGCSPQGAARAIRRPQLRLVRQPSYLIEASTQPGTVTATCVDTLP